MMMIEEWHLSAPVLGKRLLEPPRRLAEARSHKLEVEIVLWDLNVRCHLLNPASEAVSLVGRKKGSALLFWIDRRCSFT